VRTVDIVYFSCNTAKYHVDESSAAATMSTSHGLSEGRGALQQPTPFPRSSSPQSRSLLMRKILLAVAIISSLVIASTASAAQNRVSSQASGARKGPVAKLVELEKRKNEWLRQQFLGK